MQRSPLQFAAALLLAICFVATMGGAQASAAEARDAFLAKNGQVILGAIDKQRVAVLMTVIVLGLNIALNLIAIPRYGYLGAAVTTIITTKTRSTV